VLIDESTSLRRKATLIVVPKTFSEGEHPGEVYTFNLELIELQTTDAEKHYRNVTDLFKFILL
jgi:hypothetical protein